MRSRVERFFHEKIEAHGTSAEGVGWNGTASQEMRFAQLLKIVEAPPDDFSLLDYGCGYGALRIYLSERWPNARYSGYDLSVAMIRHALELHGAESARFSCDARLLVPHDYLVASGLFNVPAGASHERWRTHIRATLDEMARLATRGFAFNILTIYSDADRMRDDLYYADPHELFEYCRKTYSRRVALLHDSPLYEFSIFVRFS